MLGERGRGGEPCVGVSHVLLVCVCVCVLRSPLTLTDEDLWESRLLLRLPRCMTAKDAADVAVAAAVAVAHLRQFVSSAASPAVADTRAKHTLILPRYALCCHWQQAWRERRRMRGCYRYYRSTAQPLSGATATLTNFK